MRLLDWLHAWRDRRDPVDALIAEKGVRRDGVRPRYDGFDPDLRERTEAKRQQAERFAKASRRVSSSPLTAHEPLRRIR